MNRIQNISLQALEMKRLLSNKKIATTRKISSRHVASKQLTRISIMLTKKQSVNGNIDAANKIKSTKTESGLNRPETSRTSSATITAPYSGTTKTRITVKYDVGFGNTLSLRGQGANLSWDKGVSMRNIKADEWIWETDTPFATAEFKTLINDKSYEIGRNHLLHSGTMVQYTPRFS